MPRCSHQAMSSGRSPEVSMTMAVSAVSGSRRIRSAKVNPSISGMWASLSTNRKGIPARRGFAHPLDPLAPGCRRGDHSPTRKHFLENVAIGGVVVDSQHPQGRESKQDRHGGLVWPPRRPLPESPR